MTDRSLVLIPTYNEAANLGDVVRRLRTAVPAADVVVIDDASPDGTGEIADVIAAADPAVHVLHRTEKGGLGAAYLAGFDWGLQRDYSRMVEMDADGSHLPEQLPALLDAADDGAGLVIGSRWIPGGRIHNWPRRRLLLSRGANVYARLLIGLGVHDATAGFRVFRRETLEAIDLGSVASRGYCFQIDLTRRAVEAGVVVTEVPITFVERAHGASKMNGGIVREAVWRVTVWGVYARARRLRSILPGTAT